MNRPDPEVMHYQAIEVPATKPRKRWKVWSARPRLFATLDEAKRHAEHARIRQGHVVAIEEVRR